MPSDLVPSDLVPSGQEATGPGGILVPLPANHDHDAWLAALEAMEAHAVRIRDGLLGHAPMPSVYEVRAPSAPLPPSLAGRARVLFAEQEGLEVALRERVGMLGGALNGRRGDARSLVSLYLDRPA